MTTTAHEDQYTVAPEPVRQPYDTVAILRRNVADLELALRTQTERAEKAEAELATAREDMQSWIDSRNGWMERAGAAEAELARLREQEPVAYVRYKRTGGNVGLSWLAVPTGAFYPREGEPLYVNPVPAPAVPEFCAVEAQLTLAETEMLNAKAWSAGTQAKRHIDFAMTAICCARALLQSAEGSNAATDRLLEGGE